MALACQRDSYLKQFTSVVQSCSATETTLLRNGKKEKFKGYEVILEDTILFPEGGGQPDDRGTINGVDVLKISRRGAKAVNLVGAEIPADTEVEMKVDWTRRFDHMQQHTGQHLITSIAEEMYDCPTTSWNLGEKTSFIELDILSLSEDQVSKIEDAVNAKIMAATPVTPILFQDKNDPKLKEYRCRGLPDDHEGPVRVLHIETVDQGTLCCGTHVSNLSHLQSVKLLFSEKGKKNKTNLHFVVGGRVLNYLARCVQTERNLTALLKGPLEDHVDLAEKAVKGFKAAQKSTRSLLQDLAVLKAHKYKTGTNKDPVLVIHRKEGDNEFMNSIARELKQENVICFLTTGDEKGAGLFLIAGPEDFLKDVGPRVAELMEGRGSVNRGCYQGKANKISQKSKAESLIRSHLEQLQTQTHES